MNFFRLRVCKTTVAGAAAPPTKSQDKISALLLKVFERRLLEAGISPCAADAGLFRPESLLLSRHIHVRE